MSDRERRLMRALVRVAVAIETIHIAGYEAGSVRDDLGRVVEKAERSLRWVANRLNEELGK